MEERFDEINKIREKLYKQKIIGTLVGFCISIIGALILFFNIGKENNLNILSFVFLILGIIIIAVNSSLIKDKSNKIKQEIITRLMKEHCGKDVFYDMKKTLPELEEIIKMGLIKSPDRQNGEDYYCATYNNIKFSCSEVSLEEKQVSRDSRGHTKVTYQKYFNGRMLVFNLENLNNQIFLREKGSHMNSPKGLVKVETEVSLFNEKYNLTTDNKEMIFKYFTPSVLNNFIEFEKMVKGILSYGFYNKKLYVFVERGENVLEFRLSKKLDEREINFLLNGLRLPLEIIDKLKLGYFKEEK